MTHVNYQYPVEFRRNQSAR